MGAKINRSAKSVRRNAERSRVREMPEEQAKRRTGGRVGESFAIAVSPTGTKHFPLERKVPRVVRSRAKSPSIGRQKQGRTAKQYDAPTSVPLRTPVTRQHRPLTMSVGLSRAVSRISVSTGCGGEGFYGSTISRRIDN